MNKEKICLSTDVVEMSEENKNYLLMTDRVCFYDEPNLNGCKLPSDGAESFAQTLVDMPVYAKCRVNDKGEPTFGSHEVGLDEDGDLYFDTVPIGVHTAVEIKDDTVTIGGVEKTLPCLFATQKIWTRNKNAVAAIKRLFSEGKLHNSWELQNNEYTYSNGIKTITDYEFVGNTFLGYEYADPAYGESAKVLSISQEDCLMVAEALSQDLLAQKEEKEDETLKISDKSTAAALDGQEATITSVEDKTIDAPHAESSEAESVVAPADGSEQHPEANPVAEGSAVGEGEEAPNEGTPEVSALTMEDIYDKIRESARDLLDKWCYPVYIFPEEHTALLITDDRPDELSYVHVDYVVTDDSVTVSNPVDVKLVVQVSEINNKVSELEDEISSLKDDLEKANAEVEALKPYRESAEKAEHDNKVAKLRAYAEESGQFTSEELDSEDMNKLFEALDEPAIKTMISDRVVSASEKHVKHEAAQTVKNSAVYAGEPTASETKDAVSIMREYLKN